MSQIKHSELPVRLAQKFCLNQYIPFFSYRMPGEISVHFGAQLSERVDVFSGFGQKRDKDGFVIAPFDVEKGEPTLFIRGDILFKDTLRDAACISKLQSVCFAEKNRASNGEDTTRAEYRVQIAGLIAALREEKLRKVILARSITLPGNAWQDAPQVFERLRQTYPDAFVFMVSVPGVMTWMGATPELFLERKDEGIFTMALAGTRPMAEGDEAWPFKEQEEQQIVSEYVAAVCRDITGNEVRARGPFTYRAGNVCHLCTAFECPGSLSGSLVDRLVDGLHPTPAVGGYPKNEALALIRRTEKLDRRYYGGYLGPVKQDGKFNLYVNLRSMELFRNAWRLYVGGGITALSDADKEWNETELKSGTLLACMGNVESVYGNI